MSKTLFSISGWEPDIWLQSFRDNAPSREFVTERSYPQDSDIDYAIVWKQPAGILTNLPNLKAIFSLGAGVDAILSDTTLPEDVPIVRIISPDLTTRMSEYVLWQVLDHHRNGPRYRAQQQVGKWHEISSQCAASEVTVSILGLGTLGQDAARKLRVVGYQVHGWSRTPKQVEGVVCYHGPDGLTQMLSATDILVCLLPLTEATKGILSKQLFAGLAKTGPLGAPVLINAGRGALQVEEDILDALNTGQLSAASLDVFEVEPLPSESPLWAHPEIFVTPHAAAVSTPTALVAPIIKQMNDHDQGIPLINTVDRTASY